MDTAIFHISPDSPLPLEQQIKDNLREIIQSGLLLPEDALPSVGELSKIYGVEKNIVRRAIRDLTYEGILCQIDQVGVCVAQPKIVQELPTVLGFSARMRQSGHAILNRVLAQQSEPASAAVARRLHIPLQTPVMRLTRLRFVDNEPLMLETSFVSLTRFPDLLGDDFALRSLYEAIALRYGVQAVELDQTWEPVLMTGYEAELLNSTPGAPAMLIQVTALADPDDPFELSKSVVRGDKCQYYFRMHSDARSK